MSSNNKIEIITLVEKTKNKMKMTSYGYYDEESNFVLHRDGDLPASIVEDEKFGFIRTESYYQHGLEHRDGDLPAFIRYRIIARTKMVEIMTTYFYKHGRYHRDNDLPAFEYTSEDKKTTTKAYFRNGLLHRDVDKPAKIIKFLRQGKENIYENFYRNGELYREISNKNNIIQKINIENSKIVSIETKFNDNLLKFISLSEPQRKQKPSR